MNPDWNLPSSKAPVPNATTMEGLTRVMEFFTGRKKQKATPDQAKARDHREVLHRERLRQVSARADQAEAASRAAQARADTAEHQRRMATDPKYAAQHRRANRSEGQKARYAAQKTAPASIDGPVPPVSTPPPTPAGDQDSPHEDAYEFGHLEDLGKEIKPV